MQAIAAYPELEPESTGTPGECGTPFLAPGEVNTAFFDMLTVRLEAFEAEQQRRCDAVPHVEPMPVCEPHSSSTWNTVRRC